MRRAQVVLAALAVSAAGCGSTARGDERATDNALTAVVRSSLRVEDVRLTTRLVHSLVGAKLKLRSDIHQTPDGSSLHARNRQTDSVGRSRQREQSEMLVAQGKIFVRGGGRWRRAGDTSPLFSYDEALALIRRVTQVERIGPEHYRGDITVPRGEAAPEPLNLLDEARRREGVLNVFTDDRSRLRRLTISAGSGGRYGRVEASVEVLGFDEGLQIETPSR